jgi:hypothetical protein
MAYDGSQATSGRPKHPEEFVQPKPSSEPRVGVSNPLIASAVPRIGRKPEPLALAISGKEVDDFLLNYAALRVCCAIPTNTNS